MGYSENELTEMLAKAKQEQIDRKRRADNALVEEVRREIYPGYKQYAAARDHCLWFFSSSPIKNTAISIFLFCSAVLLLFPPFLVTRNNRAAVSLGHAWILKEWDERIGYEAVSFDLVRIALYLLLLAVMCVVIWFVGHSIERKEAISLWQHEESSIKTPETTNGKNSRPRRKEYLEGIRIARELERKMGFSQPENKESETLHQRRR